MSHVRNHLVFNSATSSLKKNLFKGRVYKLGVVEINFLRHIYTSPVIQRKLCRVFGRKILDLYIRHWSFKLKNKIKNGSIMKHFYTYIHVFGHSIKVFKKPTILKGLKVALIKIVVILIISAKLATLGLLKIKVL